MAEELLSLKWNNHQAHFVDILTFLREQEIFIDATLACGGKLYPAHKFVLSTCSDYFKQMFTKSPNKHPIVFMKDVSCRDLEALLDFMYNGEVNVPQSSLGSLIKTAEGLQIKGLAVPDDPPFSKKEHSSVLKDRRDRDQKARRDKSFSPPPKRFRERDRSPIVNSTPSSFQNHSHSRPKSPHNSSNNQISVNIGLSKHEDNLDEDSRTSAQSGASEHSINVNSKSNISSQSQLNNDETDQFVNSNQPVASEPSPGPSGLHRSAQSKEEELDIKQEEDMGLVDLGGDDDDDDWRDGEGMEGNSLDGGGGDTSASSANAQNFSDVLLPLSDGSLPSGDPAMGLIHDLNYHSLDFSLLSEEVARPFQCSFCGRRFKRKDHRVEHERIHTGERPFVCFTCSRAFVQKHQLVSHTRRKHFVSALLSPSNVDPSSLAIQGNLESLQIPQLSIQNRRIVNDSFRSEPPAIDELALEQV